MDVVSDLLKNNIPEEQASTTYVAPPVIYDPIKASQDLNRVAQAQQDFDWKYQSVIDPRSGYPVGHVLDEINVVGNRSFGTRLKGRLMRARNKAKYGQEQLTPEIRQQIQTGNDLAKTYALGMTAATLPLYGGLDVVSGLSTLLSPSTYIDPVATALGAPTVGSALGASTTVGGLANLGTSTYFTGKGLYDFYHKPSLENAAFAGLGLLGLKNIRNGWGDQINKALYYNITPWSYEGHKREIKNMVKDVLGNHNLDTKYSVFKSNPRSFDYSGRLLNKVEYDPEYIVYNNDTGMQVRNSADRPLREHAFRLYTRQFQGEPSVYTLNDDGKTYSIDWDNYFSTVFGRNRFEDLNHANRSPKLKFELPSNGIKYDPNAMLSGDYLLHNHGHVWIKKVGDKYYMIDRWDLNPIKHFLEEAEDMADIRDYSKLEKTLIKSFKKIFNDKFDITRAIGGKPNLFTIKQEVNPSWLGNDAKKYFFNEKNYIKGDNVTFSNFY